MEFPTAKAVRPHLDTGDNRRAVRTRLPGLGGGPPTPATGYFSPPINSAADRGVRETAAEDDSHNSTASPNFDYEVGLTSAAMGFHTAAIEALRSCTARAPDHSAAWRKLAEMLRLANEDEQARAADAAAERASTAAVRSERAGHGRPPGRPEKAERKLRAQLRDMPAEPAMAVLRERLLASPLDVAAMRLLAELELQNDDRVTSWSLLERALDLCPEYVGAREDYVDSLMERRFRSVAAAAQIKILLEHAPRNARYRTLNAHAMIYTGKLEAATDELSGLLQEDPGNVQLWLAYAQALHFLGARDESERAYRRCLELRPDMGEAYWGLGDMKGRHITGDDVVAMRDLLNGDALAPESRMHMLYALAQTLERAGDFADSFAAYEEGARVFRRAARESGKPHKPHRAINRIRAMKAVFTHEHLNTRLRPTPPRPEEAIPIFVVGMPRAGSTLLEQILASHSLVEGTRELPVIGDITRILSASRIVVTKDAYPDCILDLSPDQLTAFGTQVVAGAREYRKTDRPYFIDKRPWNWMDVGLIHLMLPQAKIIDIRREPMAACFAMYKQMLPSDANFSYDFGELGRYYNNYVSMMEHWKTVLPGKVHFLRYEDLVTDTEAEIRQLLDYCGLPFEEGCLRFWETDRAVSTPSAEQVRRPIFRDALAQWRNFEPWLGPLKEALARPADV